MAHDTARRSITARSCCTTAHIRVQLYLDVYVHRCEILAGLDELKMHSRRRAHGKRMHYQNTPGSAYYVLTHVSRIVSYFHAEELFRLHMTPRTVWYHSHTCFDLACVH